MKENYSINYTLTDQELYSGLRAAKAVPSKGLPQIIRTLLLAAVIAICCYNTTIDQKYITMALFLVPISLILIALVWILPAKAFKEAKAASEGSRNISLYMEKDFIRFAPNTEIKLDGTSTIKDCTKQCTFLIFPAGERDLCYMIPYRAVPLEDFEGFREMLLGK